MEMDVSLGDTAGYAHDRFKKDGSDGISGAHPKFLVNGGGASDTSWRRSRKGRRLTVCVTRGTPTHRGSANLFLYGCDPGALPLAILLCAFSAWIGRAARGEI